MSNAQINYVPRPDATPEAELDALANVYRFILDRHAERKAAEAASEPDGSSNTTIASDTEEVVRHVDQRPDIR